MVKAKKTLRSLHLPRQVMPHQESCRLAVGFCLFLTWLLAFPALGTLYVAMPDSSLADGSQLILKGEVVDHSPWGDDGRPQTRYTIAVSSVYKGTWDLSTIDVDLPGGRGSSGTLWRVAGTPHWQVGDLVLVFLTPRVHGGWTLEQFFLGGFSITYEGDHWVASRDLSEVHQVYLPGTSGVFEGQRDLDAFTQWLQDRSQGILRQPDYYLLPSDSSGSSGSSGDDGSDDNNGDVGDTGGSPPNPAGSAKGAPIKFSSLFSSTAPWPLGCGSNGGHNLRWFQFETGASIPWRTHFAGQSGLPGRGVEEMQQALEAWQDVPDTLIDLRYDGITSQSTGLRRNDGANVVLFNDPNDEIGGSWQGSGIMALGGPWFDCALKNHRDTLFHRILEADIVLQNGLESFFASQLDPAAAAQELLGHELGHTLGLAHSDDPASLMAPSLHNDGRGASLSSDDHAALLYLYGTDDEPLPDRPRALQAEVLPGLRVQLQWLDFSDNESGFRIERRRRGEPYQSVATTPPNITRWVDDSVEAGVEYFYRIRAHNAGGPSASTNRVIVLTPPGDAPKAPDALRVAPLGSERVQLTWQDQADDELSYVLELLIPGTFTWLRAPFLGAPNTTGLVVAGLTPDQRYGFRVRASNDFGASEPSNVAFVRTMPADTGCQVGDDRLCLLNGRFQVEVERIDPADGTAYPARAIPSTDSTGFFWFFQPGNFELVIKMVDGRSVNDAFWAFYDGITDLPFRIRITDTSTGAERVYDSPAGATCGWSDTQAFVEVSSPETTVGPVEEPKDLAIRSIEDLIVEPLDDAAAFRAPSPNNWPLLSDVEVPAWLQEAAAASSAEKLADGESPSKANLANPCQPDATTLCLLEGRLSVEVDFADPHNQMREGRGQAIQGTSQSGQFWFFQLDSTELVVKAVDGTETNGNLWLFAGSLTDVSYWLRATDTLTGERKIYHTPAGRTCGHVDLDAFSGTIFGDID